MNSQILTVVEEKRNLGENCSEGMAVPKKRRSKSKGRKRLSNWKNKCAKVAKKAFNAAKTILSKEKKEVTDKNQDKEKKE